LRRHVCSPPARKVTYRRKFERQYDDDGDDSEFLDDGDHDACDESNFCCGGTGRGATARDDDHYDYLEVSQGRSGCVVLKRSSFWTLLFPRRADEDFVRLHRRMSARRRHPVRTHCLGGTDADPLQ